MSRSHVTFPNEAAHEACPACRSMEARRFYEVRDVPVHSCVLLDSAEAARSFPTGDLELAFCGACGFIFNDAFKAERLDYSHDYEETQACSPTFLGFLEATIGRLVDTFGWRGGRVLEIGCGRGDFLQLVCERGGNAGIGIDPSATAGRVPRAGRDLGFRRELFGPAQLGECATHIATRHTLEHLRDVHDVLRDARAHLAHPGGAALFIEVPDVLRVLEEGAFWDLYYEHCSYFTAGSLTALAEATGFAVDEVRLVYGGQYLQLHARPAPRSQISSGTHPSLSGPVLEDCARTAHAVSRFQAACRAKLSELDARLERCAAAGERVALWGGGSKATGLLTTLPGPERVAYVVDINPEKRGRFICGTGHEMLGPDDLTRDPPDRVFAMNPIYLAEIRADLARRGLAALVEAV